MPCTDAAYGATQRRLPSGNAGSVPAMVLRTRYAVSGTNIGCYGPTRALCDVRYGHGRGWYQEAGYGGTEAG
eukprot:643131-Rhodomonas_salina.6